LRDATQQFGAGLDSDGALNPVLNRFFTVTIE
jgi:hypothetical protein